MDPDLQVWSIASGCDGSNAPASPTCPVFLTGTVDFDGAIVRSTDGGVSWDRATVKDATGWKGTQDGAPVEVRCVVPTGAALPAFGNGLPKASSTSGFLQSRFWRSADGGVTWSRLANVAPFGELVVRDLVASGKVLVAVGERANGHGAAAMRSTDGGRTWSRSATSRDRAEGTLFNVFANESGFIGLGFVALRMLLVPSRSSRRRWRRTRPRGPPADDCALSHDRLRLKATSGVGVGTRPAVQHDPPRARRD